MIHDDSLTLPLSNSCLIIQIVWPTRWTPGHPDFANEDVPVFLLTVDGVHCRVQEPLHPTKSKDPSYYSHKFKTAALDYELGISVFDNALVLMNGPFNGSRHDHHRFPTRCWTETANS